MQAGGTYILGHPKFRDLYVKIQTGLGKGNLIGNGNGFYDQWNLKDPVEPGTIISYSKKVVGNDICVSPILLNGEVHKLFFARNYPSGKITLIGAVPVPKNDDKTPLATLPSGELKSLKKVKPLLKLEMSAKKSLPIFVPNVVSELLTLMILDAL